ncbi:MAG TPA: carboxypeptidase regulatory-like domain-containing protein [Vicinamibacterales bacterium]|jgi:hypothetical protein|nr:carboxypeptidase regulatory-like domain-containing protein [Vicinamibacterales bacterium]
MNHRIRTTTLALAVLAACDDGPTRPSPPAAPPSGTPVILSVVITGPDSVPPGATAQYSAIALQSDASSRNVTSEVAWRTSDPSVLSISPTGLASAHDRGETSVTANLAERSAVKTPVIVVPAGTFRLAGIVRDSGVPVFGARVEVTSGTGQGLTATTAGTYRLYGVAGDIEVLVTADGYLEQRKRLQVANHLATVDFDLQLSRSRAEVGGTYTLRVTAAPECSAMLPPEARTRTFTAAVRQEGPRLSVVLEGSRFFVDRGRTFNRFSGTAVASHVTFYISGPQDFYYSSYGPDVVEQLTDTTLFTMSGSVVATVSSASVSGTLDGLVEAVQGNEPGRLQRIASCRSTGHQFVLSR